MQKYMLRESYHLYIIISSFRQKNNNKNTNIVSQPSKVKLSNIEWSSFLHSKPSETLVDKTVCIAFVFFFFVISDTVVTFTVWRVFWLG